ncbi:glycosyltransferase family 4 protein [Chromobacterium violaceum]|uniref:glycosyltransferase family 4 protein n=1 Tax=Chromobacterium violaceum TaxID=536 RepID=UPI001B2FE6AC|nr:glycosyltransferase family 4 protein [Chromobacterium violaceum]
MSVDSPDGLKLLWTLPYLPWPTTSGGKLRQYHLLKELALRGHRITLLVQSKEPPSAECRRELEKLVDRLIVLPRRPLRHPWTLLLAALAPHPLLASVNGFAPALRERFAELLREEWDAVQIEHSYGLQPFLAELRKRRQPFLLTEHNVESSLAAATYQHLPDWLTPFIHWDRWRYRRWERRALAAPAIVAAVTLMDAAELARRGGRQVEVVVNGVDCMAFAGVRPAYDSQRLLFIGNFEYPPNRDAVAWLVADIMPRIWRRMPEARLAVCGHAMPESWPRRWADPRLEWRGYAPALAPEQRRAAAFIAPLREGGGSKLKVLEAMAAGLPVLATPQGVSGLAVRPGEDFCLGCDDGALAEAAVSLLSQPHRAAAVGEAGRAYVRAHHDWRVAAAQLEGQYRRLSHADRH